MTECNFHVYGVFKHEATFILDAHYQQELLRRGFGATRCEPAVMQKPAPVVPAAEADPAALQPKRYHNQIVNIVNGIVKKIEAEHGETPLPPKEPRLGPLRLHDEEVFYLCSKGILLLTHGTDAHKIIKHPKEVDVEDEQLLTFSDEECISLTELWSIFSINPSFPLRYKVYEHFKAQGFVVKAGLNFGVDFTVYRMLPSHCHSEMCVYIVNSMDPLSINSAEAAQEVSTIEFCCISSHAAVARIVLVCLRQVAYRVPSGSVSFYSYVAICVQWPLVTGFTSATGFSSLISRALAGLSFTHLYCKLDAHQLCICFRCPFWRLAPHS
jgi:tRNA splicing endonuclease